MNLNVQNAIYDRLSQEKNFLVFRFKCGLLNDNSTQAVLWGPTRQPAGMPGLGVLVNGQTMAWITFAHQNPQPDDPGRAQFAQIMERQGGQMFTVSDMQDVEFVIDELQSK